MRFYELICCAICGASGVEEVKAIAQFASNWKSIEFEELDNLDIKIRPYVNETRNDNDNDLTREG